MVLVGLTGGLPINLRQLLTISSPSNPTEWIVTATKLLKIQKCEQNKIENPSNSRTPTYILNAPRDKYDVGQLRIEPQRIILKSDLPVHLRPYCTSSIQEKEIKGQVEKLLQAGLIKESNSPDSALVTLAFKRDEGKKTRLCIEFRKLNALCKTDSEPLPIMDSSLDKLARANVFPTLEFAAGYWHVPIHPKDTEKLAFCTNIGLCEWCRLTFGIKVAPAIFNRLIRRILTKYKIDFACNYFDDIIVFSSSEEHWNHLNTIFDICQKENIKLKLSKCALAQIKINRLGYEIEEGNVTPNNTNIDIIKMLKPPNSVKELQSSSPSKNGKNERVNQSLVTRLKCKVNASSTKIPWTKLLDQVSNEYNSTPHSITKYPPAYLLFGPLPCQSPIDQNNYDEPVDEARELALQRNNRLSY
ncbi:retrovirus-related Pol polyprotein from transposon 17.6 [Trichonephila clavipes]|nr:retrovirus-related Pol polyprotein from transposon 17.6 [Trichonephila clavipes]